MLPTILPFGAASKALFRRVLRPRALGSYSATSFWLGVVKGYEGEARYYQQTGHTVARVFAVLRDPRIQAPAGWQTSNAINTASDVFVGYLLLDALIGNTDRHHENWGLLLRPGPDGLGRELAPTFDHASSLGRNEPNERRTARLASKDPAYSVAGYAQRARSAFYKAPTDTRPLSTFDALAEASKLRPRAALEWIHRLEGVRDVDIRSIVEEVPPAYITPPARDFAYHFLLATKKMITQMKSKK